MKCTKCGLPCFSTKSVICKNCKIQEDIFIPDGTQKELERLLKRVVEIDVCDERYDALSKRAFVLKRYLEREV